MAERQGLHEDLAQPMPSEYLHNSDPNVDERAKKHPRNGGKVSTESLRLIFKARYEEEERSIRDWAPTAVATMDLASAMNACNVKADELREWDENGSTLENMNDASMKDPKTQSQAWYYFKTLFNRGGEDQALAFKMILEVLVELYEGSSSSFIHLVGLAIDVHTRRSDARQRDAMRLNMGRKGLPRGHAVSQRRDTALVSTTPSSLKMTPSSTSDMGPARRSSLAAVDGIDEPSPLPPPSTATKKTTTTTTAARTRTTTTTTTTTTTLSAKHGSLGNEGAARKRPRTAPASAVTGNNATTVAGTKKPRSSSTGRKAKKATPFAATVPVGEDVQNHEDQAQVASTGVFSPTNDPRHGEWGLAIRPRAHDTANVVQRWAVPVQGHISWQVSHTPPYVATTPATTESFMYPQCPSAPADQGMMPQNYLEHSAANVAQNVEMDAALDFNRNSPSGPHHHSFQVPQGPPLMAAPATCSANMAYQFYSSPSVQPSTTRAVWQPGMFQVVDGEI